MVVPSEQEVEVRLRAALGVIHFPAARSEVLRDLGLGVVEVAEGERPGRAHGHAARLEPLLDAVEAERALVDVALRVHEARVVRACRDARLAARALVVAHENDAALDRKSTRLNSS